MTLENEEYKMKNLKCKRGPNSGIPTFLNVSAHVGFMTFQV